MKTYWRLAAVLAGLTLVAAAPAEGQFGIRGGVNLTRFVGDDAENVESKQGLNFGGSMRLFNIGPIAIVPELFYSQKGARMDGVGPTTGAIPLDFSLDYLEVPVLARVNLPVPGLSSLQPYLAAGPAFAWRVNCELSMVGGDASASARDCGEQFGGADTAFREADRGVVVSGGMDFRFMGMGGVNLDARLVQGLARLSEGEGNQPDVRNQSFSLMLGYSFGM